MSKKKLTSKELLKKKVPYILIPGLLLALALGLQGGTLQKIEMGQGLATFLTYFGEIDP